jgi:hypothetical protein
MYRSCIINLGSKGKNEEKALEKIPDRTKDKRKLYLTQHVSHLNVSTITSFISVEYMGSDSIFYRCREVYFYQNRNSIITSKLKMRELQIVRKVRRKLAYDHIQIQHNLSTSNHSSYSRFNKFTFHSLSLIFLRTMKCIVFKA